MSTSSYPTKISKTFDTHIKLTFTHTHTDTNIGIQVTRNKTSFSRNTLVNKIIESQLSI